MVSFTPLSSYRLPKFSGSSSRRFGTELSRQKSEASLKRRWTEGMDQRLQQTHSDEPLGIKHDTQEEKWFVELYGKQLKLKKEDYRALLQKGIELKKKLRESKTLAGQLSQWTTLGGTALGGVADVVVHLPSLGISLVMVPPGTLTALGAAIGRVFKGKSPEQIEYELHEVESALSEVGRYLSNLEKGRREIGRRYPAKVLPPKPSGQSKEWIRKPLNAIG